jgi:hypothetical protein
MSANYIAANIVSVGAANGGPLVTLGSSNFEGDKVDYATFATPGAGITGAVGKMMVPSTRVASIGYDGTARVFEIAANGGVNMQLTNLTSGQSIETIADQNLMIGGSSIDITETTDGHLISMDSTGLKIFPGNGSPGITGAVLTSLDELGTCEWDGGSMMRRIEALEKKAGITSPERPKPKASGPSPKSRVRTPKIKERQ